MLFFLMTAFLFVSCNSDAASSGGSSEPGGNEPVAMSIVVPCVGDSESKPGSRGLQNMVAKDDVFDTGKPQSDIYYAQAVMQCMPVFPSLRTIKGVSADTSLSDLNLSFRMYGFDCTLDGDKSKLNEDGAYLRYNVIENNIIVGVLEYYYNVPNNRITYRQYMMLDIVMQVGPQDFMTISNAVMVYCIEDVELGDDLSLKANQVVGGKLKSDEARLDMFFLGNEYGGKNFFLERRVITIASDGDKTCAFCQPWSSSKSTGKPWDEVNPELQDIMKKYTKDESYLITVEKCDNFTVEAAFDFINAFYVDGEKARKGKWETYDEFIAWDLSKLSTLAPELTAGYTNMWMSYFKLSDAQNESTRGNRAYHDKDASSLKYDEDGFLSAYGPYQGDATTEYDKVFEVFLPDCGIALEDIHIVKECLGDLLTQSF